MNAFFDSEYQEKLDATIQALESKSSVELVTVIYPECDNYRDIELWGGIFLAFIALVVKFMVPAIIHIYAILFGTLLFFSLGIGIIKRVPKLKYALLNKKRMRRQAEIMARAIFQKAHIHRTSQHTGVLLFISTFERQAVLLWDIGVDVTLTIDELDQLQFQFSEIFNTPDPPEALLAKINASIPVFEGHLPVQPNDINELPNHLQVKL
ncbi:MAG: Putative membrane protein [uncultured Aureispira sp.]|jgi:putative membrane protein|uniref:Membrane protein n=1 Tax=uncultured Aureispira sp. TaxID=1331704 RepID=A0A6S6TNF6_9BACT|nr:MAG: Putative membrane protein [uncultured Aureispira sp.]